MKNKTVYYVEVIYRSDKTEWYKFPNKRILVKFIYDMYFNDCDASILKVHEVKE